jgi:hypothetical protein
MGDGDESARGIGRKCDGFTTEISEGGIVIDFDIKAPSNQWSLHPLRFPRYRGTETPKGERRNERIGKEAEVLGQQRSYGITD